MEIDVPRDRQTDGDNVPRDRQMEIDVPRDRQTDGDNVPRDRQTDGDRCTER